MQFLIRIFRIQTCSILYFTDYCYSCILIVAPKRELPRNPGAKRGKQCKLSVLPSQTTWAGYRDMLDGECILLSANRFLSIESSMGVPSIRVAK